MSLQHGRVRARGLLAGIAMGALAACQIEAQDGQIAASSQPVTGGMQDAEFSGACGMLVELPPDENDPDLERDPQMCSCSRIGQRVVLTAAHCVEENARAHAMDPDAGWLDKIDLRFGVSYGAGDAISQVIAEVLVHRYFNPDLPGTDDVAVILLGDDPPANTDVVSLNEQQLTSEVLSGELVLVGYGLDAEDPQDRIEAFGLRRQVLAPINSVSDVNVLAGNNERTSCAGDGGGPGFFDFGAGPVQVTVTSVNAECATGVSRLPVDNYLEEMIYPYVDAQEGPCALDGSCVEDCPRTPDPDCDPCGFDGTCEEDCPSRDWDCDLGALPGEACAIDGECERGGRCVTAEDDSAFTYCTQACDPSLASPRCPPSMACADNGDGTGDCVFDTPSPGSQGFPCDLEEDCRSGICETGICVIECAADADCPAAPDGEDPYTCEPSRTQRGATVCLGRDVAGGGGFCAVGEGPSARGGIAGRVGGIAVLLLAALAIVFSGRRRR